MTSTPCGTPKAFGLSTITWIARTRIPLLVVPEHGGTPPPLQVCSLRMTEPIPGNRIVVLGGGLSFTNMPPTESPIRLVPCGSDEDLPPPETLLACEVIALANPVHTPATGSAHRFCGIPAHRSEQRGTSSGLREVGVRLGMRDHHVNGIPGQRQASNVDPDHVHR